MVLYAAFGSNTDRTQFRSRCPSAKSVGRGVVQDHRLEFAGWSAMWGGGVATLRPHAKSAAPVVMYRIPVRDLFELDRYEGHPDHYRRVLLTVLLDGDPRGCEAWAYLLPEGARPAAPSAQYLERIASGYAAHRLDLAALDAAAARVRS